MMLMTRMIMFGMGRSNKTVSPAPVRLSSPNHPMQAGDARGYQSQPEPRPKKRAGTMLIDSPVLDIRFESLYRVVLHKKNLNDIDAATRAVKSAIPSLSVTEAKRGVETAFRMGTAILITCTKTDAEYYVERIRRSNMFATFEEA